MARDFPRVEPPHRLPDGTYEISIHRSPDDIRARTAPTLAEARELYKFYNIAKEDLLVPDHPERGRPTSLTVEVRKEICDAIADGCTYEHAARAAEVSEASIRDWKARGRRGEQPFADFLAALKTAEAKGIRTRMRKINTCCERWQALMCINERRHRLAYGRSAPLEVHLTSDVDRARAELAAEVFPNLQLTRPKTGDQDEFGVGTGDLMADPSEGKDV